MKYKATKLQDKIFNNTPPVSLPPPLPLHKNPTGQFPNIYGAHNISIQQA